MKKISLAVSCFSWQSEIKNIPIPKYILMLWGCEWDHFTVVSSKENS